MLRAALRSLLAHRVRLALTIVTIALGIAFVTGTNIFTDSLQRSFDALVTQPRADVSVRPAGGEGGPGGGPDVDTVRTMPEELVAVLAELPEAAAVYGVAGADGAFVLDQQGEVVGPNGPPARGRSWVPDPAATSISLNEGQAPDAPNEVALLDATAQAAGVTIGDSVRIDTPSLGVREFTVVGTVSRSLSGGLGGTLALFDLPTSQEALLEPGLLTDILVQAAPSVTQDDLAAAVRTALTDAGAGDLEVRTGAESADEVAQRVEEGFGFFNTFLLAFGAIALFVSTFLIFNTFAMLVAQRTRELALLRAVGATRGQVARSVLIEAVILGAVAAVLGLLGGVGVSWGLRWLIDRLGAPLPPGPLVVEPATFALAVGVGLVVTVLSAAMPARRASSVPPVAAMRDDASLAPRSLRRLTIVAVVLLVAAVPAAVMGLGQADVDGGVAAAWIGVAALLALIGIIALTPAASRPLIGLLGFPLRGSAVGRLATQNARRNPRRTAATASALTIGLALMTAVAVIGSSARSSVDDVVDSTIGADFVLFGQGFQPFSPEVYQAVRDTPGTEVVTYVRTIPAEVDGEQFAVTGVDPDLITQAVTLPMVSGSLTDLGLGDAAIDTDTAATLGVSIGDVVDAQFVNGPGSLRIRAIYEAAGPFQGMITTLPTVDSLGTLTRDTAVYIVIAPDAVADDVRTDLNERLSAFPSVRVQDQADIKAEIGRSFDLLFGFVYGLLALSVIVAFLGIVNTLSLSVFERIREIGLIRAVGAVRAQVRRMVLIEAILIAALGTVVGIGLGVVLGTLLQRVLEPQGITQLTIPPGQIIVFAALGLAGGAAASLWPAWRASRLPVLKAIATE